MAIAREGFKLPKVQSPDDTVVKNSPAYAGDRGDRGLIPGLGRSPGAGNEMATHSSIHVRGSRGERNLVGYSLWGHKESDRTEHTCMKARSEKASKEGF